MSLSLCLSQSLSVSLFPPSPPHPPVSQSPASLERGRLVLSFLKYQTQKKFKRRSSHRQLIKLLNRASFILHAVYVDYDITQQLHRVRDLANRAKLKFHPINNK